MAFKAGESYTLVEICGRAELTVTTFLNSCYFVVLWACLTGAYQRSGQSSQWHFPLLVGDNRALPYGELHCVLVAGLCVPIGVAS